MQKINKRLYWIVAAGLIFGAINTPVDGATNITPTPGAGGLGTQVLPPNNNIYGIRGGKTVGNNLFHSFGQFSVATGDTAQFQTTNLIPNASMSNILGRVTGGNASALFGTIDSATFYPNANLFLINPAGFLFGPSATVNVGGIMHVTTADYLKLADGNLFKAIPDVAADALLNASPVAAFGFLGSNPAAIAVQGSQLTVANGTGLSLVGGNRGFDYIDPDTGATGSVPNGVTMTGGMISAPSGQINLVSVASPGEISTVDFLPSPGMTMGSIALTEGAVLNVSGDGGGIIRIRSGQLVMDNAGLVASSLIGTLDPSTGISVNVQGDITLSHQSAMLTDTQGDGFGGDIEIHASNLLLTEGSVLYTQNFGAGKAGDIRIALSGDLSLVGAGDIGTSGFIASDNGSTASGPGGSINITSSSMTVNDFGMVTTRAFGFARAGDINIDTGRLNVAGGGVLQTLGGNDLATSGNISIHATDSITLAGPSDTILNENLNGGTGTITIITGRLDMSDEARINSQTFFDADPAAANAPKIAINADSSITLSSGSRIDVGGFFSDTGSLNISTGNLAMSGLSSITTLSNSIGAAGPIVMNVENLDVSEGSQILSFSSGGGRGGDITVNATGSVLVTGQGTDLFGATVKSGIFSNTMAGFADPSFTANAGNISITAQSLEVSNGARIDSSTQGYALGNAGNITVGAPNLSLNGGTISNFTEFAGNAGTTVIKADTLSLTNGGSITSSAVMRSTPLFEGETIPSPTGKAGNVTIQGTASPAQSVVIDGAGSGILTTTSGTGAGGNISVNANAVNLQNGARISSSSTGTGVAGDITINAGNQFAMTNSAVTTEANHSSGGTIKITTNPDGTVQLTDSTISASVSDGTGGGGSVNIDPQYVVLQNSQIIATAVSGPGGNIFITTNLLLPDSASVISASSQFGQQGTVTIQSPASPASGKIVPLGQKPLLSTSLFNQRCTALAGGNFSSFTMAGRDILPTEPSSWLSSPLALGSMSENKGLEAKTEDDTPLLSLRQIAPPGFLTQVFATDPSGCQS
jgi:filamentous hemagglutinin family protein